MLQPTTPKHAAIRRANAGRFEGETMRLRDALDIITATNRIIHENNECVEFVSTYTQKSALTFKNAAIETHAWGRIEKDWFEP